MSDIPWWIYFLLVLMGYWLAWLIHHWIEEYGRDRL